MAAILPSILISRALGNDFLQAQYSGESIAKRPFKPTWESLQNYKTPEWFRDAKFWYVGTLGPQCQPESGY